MIFTNLSKRPHRNLQVVQTIVEETPGDLPVQLEHMGDAEYLTVSRESGGRFEKVWIVLRPGWLDEPLRKRDLAQAVQRFAASASGLTRQPFARA